jgi:hypothetical protein
MANDTFYRRGLAFIDAKMNARSRLDVVADLCANAVRAVVDHAALKRLFPVEHRESQRQAVRMSGIPASFLRWGHHSQAIDSTIAKIRSDHGASPWFKKRHGLLFDATVRLSLRKGYAMPLEGRTKRYFRYDFVWLERTAR